MRRSICTYLLLLTGLMMAGQGNATPGRPDSLNSAAAAFLGKEPIKALRLAERAKREAESDGNRRQLFEALKTQAVALSEAGQPKEAEDAIVRARHVADVLNNDTLRALAANTLGYFQMNKGDGKVAQVTFKEAFNINSRIGNAAAAHKNLLNLAILDYHFFSRPSQGMSKFERVRRWAEAHKDYTLLSGALSNLAGIALNEGHTDQAKAFLNDAMEANNAMGNVSQRVFNLNQMAMMYMGMQDLREADRSITQAVKVAEEAGLSREMACAYSTAADVKEAEGQTAKALHFFKLATHLHDSINQAQRAQAAELSAMVMDTERQVRENEVLRRDKQLQSQKISFQHTAMVLGAGLALVLIGLLITSILSNRKVSKLVGMLKQQNHLLIAQREEIGKLNSNLEAQVLERTGQLQERTKQILDYASYNSHIVRGPLARIMGLSFLLQHTHNEEDVRLYLDKMVESAQEMDNAVKTVNRKLELEEADYLNVVGRRTIRHISLMG